MRIGEETEWNSMSGAKIIRRVQQPDGGAVWSLGDIVVASVSADEAGEWRVLWRLEACSQRSLVDRFSSPHSACLAAEKFWPARLLGAWVESADGGYFRQFGASRVYIRKTDQGWYAVRKDGKVLGRAAQIVWFARGSDAFAAVEREHCTPFDADPFHDNYDRYAWLTINRCRAA
jgi:hypothetical protein